MFRIHSVGLVSDAHGQNMQDIKVPAGIRKRLNHVWRNEPVDGSTFGASAYRTARKQLSIFPLEAFTASDGASAEF